MMRHLILAGWMIVGGLLTQGFADDEPQRPLTRIAFGSCAKQDRPQPIWDSILAQRPEVFLFLGDNIYADTRDPEVMRAKYTQLAAIPGYQRLKANTRILATWDDHDYGENDAGREYPMKEEAQRIFNDFFEVPADSPRRQRPGIYDAEIVGPAGRRVQFLLLDTRYFRDPLNNVGRREVNGYRTGPYAPVEDDSATMLGQAQWKWLADELRKPAEVRIIASSIQLVSGEHGWETWGNMPAERQRLYDLIGETRAQGAIVVSGDRHLAEISCDKVNGPYPIYDATSSSLNSPFGANIEEPNPHRLGKIYPGANFGTINIDWPANRLTLAIHNLQGEVVLKQDVDLATLQVPQE